MANFTFIISMITTQALIIYMVVCSKLNTSMISKNQDFLYTNNLRKEMGYLNSHVLSEENEMIYSSNEDLMQRLNDIFRSAWYPIEDNAVTITDDHDDMYVVEFNETDVLVSASLEDSPQTSIFQEVLDENI